MRVARLIFLAVALLVPLAGVAQPVVSEPAAELGEIAFQQALKDLSNDLRLLCVAAHPDDEDGATLAYHRFKYGIETHVLICTRGEGGQNEIGPELYEDLAVIRTKEMQEAAKIEGAQLHFLDMPEFGYSKTLEETLEVWGEEELVRRMVRKIREIRPHVIITHHGKMKDHGHHQAVGWALKKAFDLAGDPDYVLPTEVPEESPEQGVAVLAEAFEHIGTELSTALEGLQPPDEIWQPARLFIRDFTGTLEGAAVVDISEKDATRCNTYAEIAAEALRAHKSQGMEHFIQMLLTGSPKAHYFIENESQPSNAGSELYQKYVSGERAIEVPFVPSRFMKKFGEPGWTGKRLELDGSGAVIEFQSILDSEAATQVRRISWDSPELRDAFEPELVDDRYGPLFENVRYIPESSFSIAGLEGDDLAAALVYAVSIGVFEEETEGDLSVKKRQIFDSLMQMQQLMLFVEPEDGVVVPGQKAYFSVKELNFDEEPRFPTLKISGTFRAGFQTVPSEIPSVGIKVSESLPINIPQRRHVNRIRSKFIRIPMQKETESFLAPDTLNVETHLTTTTPLENGKVKYARQGGPNLSIPLDIAPPVLPEFRDGPYLLRHGVAREATVPVKLTNYTPGPHTQTVTFGVPEGWVVEPASVEMEFAREDEEQVITLAVRAPEGVAPGSYTITADTEKLGFTEEAQVAVVDFAPPPGEPLIGIVDSYDVQFRAAMDKMGVRWEAVTEQDFTPERLDRYDVLLVDMRSYLYRPDLKAYNAAALAYVERGGTMIVNYHKTFDWAAEFAPHRLVLSNNRVTREDAPVTLREPQHPVWTTPNAIGPADWEGWRQERGLYFAGEWDDAYTPLLETSDPDEVIPPGAMLIADHGEGKYLYTALVWYRQLRELNPGAVRIFANMLAL